MARQARNNTCGCYLHVIVRGIGKQLLFEEPQDYRYFLWLLEKYSKDTFVDVCAYCLMENHVHLLVYDSEGKIPLFMKKLGVSYSYYFNKKYERTGHLFQDRYQSERIDNDEYLFTAFRYILKNPQAAGISPASQYEWNSYKLYGDTESFVKTDIFSERFKTKENYREFIEADEDDVCMDISSVRIGDNRAKEIIRDKLGCESGTAIQSFDRENRDNAIRLLLDNGLSIRQVERLTGISRGVIQKICW